jgi:hypothetical protein
LFFPEQSQPELKSLLRPKHCFSISQRQPLRRYSKLKVIRRAETTVVGILVYAA